MFAIALAVPFSVRLVGDLPVAEIILVPLVPVFWVLRKRQPVPPVLKTIFFLMGAWLFGQILTDLYRRTPAVDWMRGDAAIVFFALDLAGLYVLLTGSEGRKAIFLVGMGIGELLLARFAPSVSAQQSPWKFGYAYGTTMLVVLISCFFYSHRKYMLAGLCLVGIIGVHLLENFRSPVLNLLIAMVLVLPIIPEQIGRLRLLPRAGSAMRVAVLAGMAIGAGLAASALVHLATSAGLVNEEDQAKNREQSGGGVSGILLGGRPELLVSSRAVMESPILGHGSWAKDYKYEEMLSDMLVEQGMQVDLHDVEINSDGTIPAHSHLMGSWVWAGILGAVFWIFILWLAIKGIVRVTFLKPALAPIYAWMLVSLVWDILFSPFGSTLRMQESLLLVVIIEMLGTERGGVEVFGWMRRRKWRRQVFRGHIPTPGRKIPAPGRVAGLKLDQGTPGFRPRFVAPR